MDENLLNDARVFVAGKHLQGATACTAGLNVDVVAAFQALRLGHRCPALGDLAFQSGNLGGLISLRFALISVGAGFHPPSIKLRFVQAQFLGCRRYPKPLRQR